MRQAMLDTFRASDKQEPTRLAATRRQSIEGNARIMNGLRPDHLVLVRLPAQQWDHVLRALARQPFEEVAPLIGEIQRQCQMQEMQQRTAPMPCVRRVWCRTATAL